MKLHKTTKHGTSETNSTAFTSEKSPDESTEADHPKAQLKAVPANGRTEFGPTHVDIAIQPSTLLLAKSKGFSESFVHMIKEVCLAALDGFKPGDIVDSPMLCAEIRYGLSNDKSVAGAKAPGLSRGERINAGSVVLSLAYTEEHPGELPLKSLGRNSANLQQYRVK